MKRAVEQLTLTASALCLAASVQLTAYAQGEAKPKVNPTAKRFLLEGNTRAQTDLDGAIQSYQNAITADANLLPLITI